jgi:hypothetical protein
VGPGEPTTELQDAEEDLPANDSGRYINPPMMGQNSAQGRGSVTPVSEASAQPETPPSESLDADHDDAPLRYRKMSEIIGPGSPPGHAARGF